MTHLVQSHIKPKGSQLYAKDILFLKDKILGFQKILEFICLKFIFIPKN